MPSKQEISRVKKLATAILKKKNISQEEWIYEKYQQLILENADLLIKTMTERKD